MEHYDLQTKLGPVRISAENGMIKNVSFVDEIEYDDDSEILRKAALQLREYFEGTRKVFDLHLELHGTEFQLAVWKALQEIPYGETCSYQDIARKVGNEKAVRAVGGANHVNPIGIIIPCHRVIGKNGKMVGYAGGIHYKSDLLLHEKQHV